MSDRLAEIRGRLEAATPGPWWHTNDGWIMAEGGLTIQHWNSDKLQDGIKFGNPKDIDFIANAPTDIRYLLDEVERLQERCDAYKGQVRAGEDEIKQLRKFESDALPILDAYEHMHTRALRAEAENESLRGLKVTGLKVT